MSNENTKIITYSDTKSLVSDENAALHIHNYLKKNHSDYLDEVKSKELDTINKEQRDGERLRADEQMRMDTNRRLTQQQQRDQRCKLFDSNHGLISILRPLCALSIGRNTVTS